MIHIQTPIGNAVLLYPISCLLLELGLLHRLNLRGEYFMPGRGLELALGFKSVAT
jgi:hypothetical protein